MYLTTTSSITRKRQDPLYIVLTDHPSLHPNLLPLQRRCVYMSFILYCILTFYLCNEDLPLRAIAMRGMYESI